AIFQKIRENKQISSGELEFISDYLDNKKDIESETYKEYMEYIFKNNNNIIGTPKILSAILTYMPGFYDKGYACGVKNARTYLAHTDGKDKDGDDIPILIAHSSVAYNYTCFDWNYFKDMELNSYNSINSSRSFKDRDIVHLAFIAFHELTHQKQKIDAREDGNFDGAAKEINWILGKKDYHRNHDTDETEIDADERGWMKASSFVARFLGKQKELWSKCRRNAEDVRGRRAFSIKTDSKGKGKRYMDYDVSSVLEIVRNNPGILKKYPHLARIIDDYGRIKTDLLFNEEIATTNAGREFCNYIINHVPEDLLKQKIASGRYNMQQITKLLSNLVEVSHSNALALRNLKTVDFKTYSETDAKIEIEKQLENVYNYYFVECGQQMEKFESIVRFAYEKRVINKETADSYQSFFEDYYFEMLDNINNPNNYSVKGMVLNLQRSKSERIRNVAGQTIQFIQQKRIGNAHGINVLQSAVDATKQHTTTGDINGIGDTIKKSTLHIDNPDIDKTD
nr:hypothetical protein [Clostridia bacterium]